jgi:hypothetical protein
VAAAPDPGGVSPTSVPGPTYLPADAKSVVMTVNVDFSCDPSVLTTVMMATEMPAAIRPYSPCRTKWSSLAMVASGSRARHYRRGTSKPWCLSQIVQPFVTPSRREALLPGPQPTSRRGLPYPSAAARADARTRGTLLARLRGVADHVNQAPTGGPWTLVAHVVIWATRSASSRAVRLVGLATGAMALSSAAHADDAAASFTPAVPDKSGYSSVQPDP